MPLPSPYADEPAVQLDPALVIQWRELEEKADQYKKEAAKVKALLMEKLGNATAGLVGEDKVITYRPSAAWATTRLMAEHGDLTQHFMRTVEREIFDLDAFRLRHPDIAKDYQIRTFRAVE
jgi:hypothetical protein